MLSMRLVIDLINGDEELSVLAVLVRLNLCLADDGKGALPAGDLVEDDVHLLEGSEGGFGVEEVDGGDHDGVDDGEDEVGLPLDVVEADRGNHDNLYIWSGSLFINQVVDAGTHHKVPNPVGASRQSIRRRTNTQRRNLSGIQPSHAQPTDREEGVEDKEEHNDSNLAGLVILVRGDSSQDGHGQCLTDGAEQHELTAADALDKPDSGPRGKEIFGTVESGEETGGEGRHVEIGVNCCCVVGDEVDTADLLIILVSLMLNI